MISIIIPALNEARALPATLRSVASQTAPFEVIVVDGGSTDGTAMVANRCAQDHQCADRVRVIAAPRGRATQMNAGAFAATGDWLLFLHADTLLPAGALDAIAALDRTYEFGGFHHSFDRNDWRLRLVSALHNFRCTRTGVFYGDQAMFVRRAMFLRLGGFPAVRYLEDVMLSEQLLRHARSNFLQLSVVTDARKFVSAGIWRSLYRCLVIIAAYRWGRRDAHLRPATRFFEDVR
ncbi:MAG: TIGR04283 family arsenosugar biosynthesis glycosyltransferase [Burkholderiales bacterium]